MGTFVIEVIEVTQGVIEVIEVTPDVIEVIEVMSLKSHQMSLKSCH